MRAFLINLTLALTSIILALAGLEALAWQIAPPPRPGLPQNMFEIGPGRVWRMAPNFQGEMNNRIDYRGAIATADGEGHRIVPAAPKTAPRRLLVIGDSQSFGHGLGDVQSWPNRLQERLNQRGMAVQVVNLAVPAINADQYQARIDLIADQITPADTVLIGLSWNDLITPPSENEAQKLVEGYLVNATDESQDTTKARVKFYDWSGIVVPPFQDMKSFLDALSQSSALVGLLYPRAKAVYYRLRDHSPVTDLVRQNVPEANFLYLKHIRDVTAAHGARLIVALLPERQFFEDEAYRVYSVGGRDFPTADYQAALALPLCGRFEMACVNTFPLLHDHQAEHLAFAVDGHFNDKGAALLGPWLADAVYPSN
jgi:lysophospholipase L1-like esterase